MFVWLLDGYFGYGQGMNIIQCVVLEIEFCFKLKISFETNAFFNRVKSVGFASGPGSNFYFIVEYLNDIYV